ncbi:MAG: ComEC/Rec2 family competence protein [Planctomycetota bacterium]|jgi:competence protein ComEC
MSGDSGDASEGSAARPRATNRRPTDRLTVLALCLAAGVAAAHVLATDLFWPWLLGGAALLGLSLACRRRLAGLRWILVCLAASGLGGARVVLQEHLLHPDDLAGWLTDERVLVRVRGVAIGAPEWRDRAAGSMARFDYRDSATYFPLRVEALRGRDGTETPVRGRVFVRIDGTVEPFRAGDGIDASGYLRRPSPPRNPGQFDVRRYARSIGQAGLLSVPHRDLLVVRPRERGMIGHWWARLRDTMRRRAGAWLLSNLPRTDRPRRDALLAAMLLGEREPDLAGLDDSFRRVGLAHLLAISGLHVGVLAGFVLLIVRAGGTARRWHGWLLIVAVLAYLLVVETRLPVLRAGVMTIAASLGLAAGRRLSVRGLIALSAIALLLWRPDQLFSAGFQLSFGVVLALIHLAPSVRRRWFGPPDYEAASAGQMLGQWARGSLASAATAWLVAAPLVLYHFGIFSPLAVPLSVIALPLVALLLGAGYAKMLLAIVLPSAAMLAGALLSVLADLMISIVDAADALPFASMRVPFPAAGWTVATLVITTWWAWEPNPRRRRLTWVALALALAWALWPLRPWQALPPLRIDLLAVGDGTCLVVRSGGRTVLFDAGSSTDLDAGRRTIVPALHRLGVRSVEAIAVSHANLDHYAAVLEVVDAMDVGTVFLTPQFMLDARAHPFGPAAHLLDGLTKRRVAVTEAASGTVRTFGVATWTWLHPQPDASYRRSNDTSMVIRVEAAGRRLLLCGDVQAAAIDDLLARQPDLLADIVELPHHGSYNGAAARLIAQVDPLVVLQSTGWTRWQGDRWSESLRGRVRLVTARDGACSVEVDEAGGITTRRLLSPGETEDPRRAP